MSNQAKTPFWKKEKALQFYFWNLASFFKDGNHARPKSLTPFMAPPPKIRKLQKPLKINIVLDEMKPISLKLVTSDIRRQTHN